MEREGRLLNHKDTTPAAEKGVGKYRTPTNEAGIDISDGLWQKFGLTKRTGSIQVEWYFVD